ncbi:MAG: choice-of-anchor J domain-containing protein [Bacteroidota bacterium]
MKTKKTRLSLVMAMIIMAMFNLTQVKAQGFTENFDAISNLTVGGWAMVNASVPVGTTTWSQGPSVSGGGPFDAYNGAADAYISANYNSTGTTGTISTWLLTPNLTLKNGDVLTFYTRKPSPDSYADRLEIRMSANGASTDVGTGLTVGDFSTLLLSVNPTLVLGVYPTTWTQFTVTVSGLSAPTSGRLAFRYFVTSGGSSGSNSDFIGLDNVVYTPYVCPAFTLTSGGSLTGGAAGVAYNGAITQTGALGTPTFTITAGALPPGLILATDGSITGTPTATGTFNFTVTVSDMSGCTGSQSYSLTIVCGPNPTSLNGLPALCSNDSPITLTEGLPAGGNYFGTGVTGNTFNPAVGSQLITYEYTDAYACYYTTNANITVNTAPVVTQAPLSTICITGAPFMLSGGSPAGGTYSGTGVNTNIFDPATAGLGTFPITYTYSDGTCSATAIENITVDACTGIDDVAGVNFSVYPNPGNGQFNLIPGHGQTLTNIRITDINGRLVFSCTDEITNPVMIDLSNEENGVYLLKGMLNGQFISSHFIKQ